MRGAIFSTYLNMLNHTRAYDIQILQVYEEIQVFYNTVINYFSAF